MRRRPSCWAGLPWWADMPPRPVPVLGIATSCHTIGSFARAVGRSPVTVRRWVRLGVVPETPFKDAWGVTQRHRRLWPEPVLWEIARLAEVTGVLQGQVPDAQFRDRLADIYRDAVDAAVLRATVAGTMPVAG